LKPRTLAEAELLATLIPGNVKAPPDPRGLPFDLDTTDAAFAAGAVLAFVGVALVFVPLALFIAGVSLMFICWRLA
jgi:hypothetical protein